MKFEIRNRWTCEVQFAAELSAEYENQARPMQLGAAVRMAVQASASLQHADLRCADLRDADLRHADLRRADLRDADLRHADLWRADLRDADLRDADLRDADLWRADLRDADLRDADLRDADLRRADLRIYHGIYTVVVTPSHVHIGCERRTPEQWLGLTEDDADMINGERAVEALRQDGPVIKAMIEQMRPDLAERPTSEPAPTTGPLRRALAFVWPMDNA
jgi:hypothetical protein